MFNNPLYPSEVTYLMLVTLGLSIFPQKNFSSTDKWGLLHLVF